MKQFTKKKLIVLAVLLGLVIPLNIAIADDNIQKPSVESSTEVVTDAATSQDKVSTLPDNNVAVPSTLPYKQPTSKRALVKRFLLAMFGVLGSSLLIYFGLTFYNKIRNNIEKSANQNNNNDLLTSPTNMEEAVKTFLDKTKW